MLKLRDGIIELYKKVATSIPGDVEEALKTAYSNETEPLAKESLNIILQNITTARKTSRPICQDTGFPVFYVKVPKGLSHQLIKGMIMDATRIATNKIPLRPNAVDIITEKNTGDNVGDHFPIVYTEETVEQFLAVDLMLKGGGCENLGQTYKLPMVLDYEIATPLTKGGMGRVLAERDFEGVRKCVLDAVFKAQGRGCPPYTIGVAIGGAKDQVTFLSKKQLMRRITDTHSNAAIAELESKILNDINSLGIGTAGLGGRTTAIGVKIAAAHRHPASYFVDISFSCWANRRGRLIW
ncbi:MAG: fumarate hydratase [Nitrospirae bacterium]|nr:fumarate hydratase [Nitrospirota bacterium]MDA8213962.1 fumarate hydratase [Nitrospiraceae bacterium]